MAEEARLRQDRRSRQASLNREQAAYEANLPHWLSEHEGKHVLIKGDEVLGFYETRDEALAAGDAAFGVVPLLVRLVTPSEPVYHLPNALLQCH
jgi:hypothetical protein